MVSISRQDAVLVLDSLMLSSLSVHWGWMSGWHCLDDAVQRMTRDGVSEVRGTLRPLCAAPSVCCVSQAWPSVELSTRRLCSRHGTGQVGAGGPAPLSPSDHRCPPPVSWHRGMSLNIGSRGHKREDRTWVSRGPSSVVSTGKKCHTHWDYQMINPLYLVIFRPDSRHLLTWADKSDGNRWELLGVAVFEFYISLPTLFLCLVSTWHEIMDRSRKGNIWFILFYATLK